MATSGVYTYSANQNSIVLGALRKVMQAGDFETVTAGDARYTAAVANINPLIKLFMTYGMPVWATTEQTIAMSLIGTTAGVTIGIGQTINSVAPLKVLQALRIDNTSSISVPLNIYTYEDYEILSNKTSTGAPVHLFYQPLRNSGVVKVWPLPDPTYWQVNGSLYIRYQRPYQDFTTGTDEPDFPIEWTLPLTYALAYLLAPEYGIDPTQRAALKSDRDEFIAMALSYGTEEGSITFQPRMI